VIARFLIDGDGHPHRLARLETVTEHKVLLEESTQLGHKVADDPWSPETRELAQDELAHSMLKGFHFLGSIVPFTMRPARVDHR
jgi:hypothetical protein